MQFSETSWGSLTPLTHLWAFPSCSVGASTQWHQREPLVSWGHTGQPVLFFVVLPCGMRDLNSPAKIEPGLRQAERQVPTTGPLRNSQPVLMVTKGRATGILGPPRHTEGSVGTAGGPNTHKGGCPAGCGHCLQVVRTGDRRPLSQGGTVSRQEPKRTPTCVAPAPEPEPLAICISEGRGMYRCLDSWTTGHFRRTVMYKRSGVI